MTSEDPTTTDPARTLELLWAPREAPSRGPKPKLTVEQVVWVAIAVADERGLGELSMRRIADFLGVGTMSLYTYVPGKAELLDLMVDTVLGELTVPDEPMGWRERLERSAVETWDLLGRHRWMLEITTPGQLPGPNALAQVESVVAAVDTSGLDPGDVLAVTNLVDAYVLGAAQRAAQTTELQMDAVQAARYAELMERWVDLSQYPTLARLTTAEEDAASVWTAERFHFGLARLLDGIERYVTAQT